MRLTLFTILFAALAATSCSDQYLVTGTSNVNDLEGQMLFLKVYDKQDLSTIDSSRVVHGKFNFKGRMDSTVMANVCFDDAIIMPVVLEQGEVSLKIDEAAQTTGGTPLNDTLCSFIQKKTQLDAQLAELPHLESQMIMNGIEHEDVISQLTQQAQVLSAENDRLVTSFIKSNYNNVLGPGVFMILTSQFQYPVLNPQIEAIISTAPPYFLANPYVQEYMKMAEKNMEKMHNY